MSVGQLEVSGCAAVNVFIGGKGVLVVSVSHIRMARVEDLGMRGGGQTPIHPVVVFAVRTRHGQAAHWSGARWPADLSICRW